MIQAAVDRPLSMHHMAATTNTTAIESTWPQTAETSQKVGAKRIAALASAAMRGATTRKAKRYVSPASTRSATIAGSFSKAASANPESGTIGPKM